MGKSRARIPSMGHHTWLYVTFTSLLDSLLKCSAECRFYVLCFCIVLLTYLMWCLDVLSGTGQADNQQKEQAKKHQVAQGELIFSFIELYWTIFGVSLMEVLLWLPSRFFKAYGQLSLSNCLLRGVCVCVSSCVCWLHWCINWPLETSESSQVLFSFSCFLMLSPAKHHSLWFQFFCLGG